MKYRMIGHSLKKAAEEMIIVLFPYIKLVYSDDAGVSDEDYMLSTLSFPDSETISGEATISLNGKKAYGHCSVSLSDIPQNLKQNSVSINRLDENVRKRYFSYAVRESIYSAACQLMDSKPEWGSLTGVRPSKTALIDIQNSPKNVGEEYYIDSLINRYHVSESRAKLAVTCALKGKSLIKGLDYKDIGLYISIPFCPTRCKYCSFVSHSIAEAGYLVDKYIDMLEYEIKLISNTVKSKGLKIRAVYIGGGTPTSLNDAQLERVLSAIGKNFSLNDISEYTVEAGRPDTITPSKLTIMKNYGVNRISVNPQSMNDDVLRAASRPHTAEDMIRAFKAARTAGFGCINTDVIAGLEQDTPESFCSTIDKLISLSPENITIHTLSYKKGALMKSSGMYFNDAKIKKMLDYAYKTLDKNSYQPYYVYRQKYMAGAFENVGFSINGKESLYNIAVMEETLTTVGLGAGAATKLVDPRSGKIERAFNTKYPYEYVKNAEKLQANNSVITNFFDNYNSYSLEE